VVAEVETLLSAEAKDRYATFLTAIRQAIDEQERVGIAPQRVAEVVAKALTTARPRARYLVGRDAQAIGLISRFAPDRVRDPLVRKFAGI